MLSAEHCHPYICLLRQLLKAGGASISEGRLLELLQSEVAQSCRTLCDPMDCSLPGSSVLGIFQARVLEWVAISFSKNFYKQWINIAAGSRQYQPEVYKSGKRLELS